MPRGLAPGATASGGRGARRRTLSHDRRGGAGAGTNAAAREGRAGVGGAGTEARESNAGRGVPKAPRRGGRAGAAARRGEGRAAALGRAPAAAPVTNTGTTADARQRPTDGRGLPPAAARFTTAQSRRAREAAAAALPETCRAPEEAPFDISRDFFRSTTTAEDTTSTKPPGAAAAAAAPRAHVNRPGEADEPPRRRATKAALREAHEPRGTVFSEGTGRVAPGHVRAAILALRTH